MANNNPKLRPPSAGDIDGTPIVCQLPSPPAPDRRSGRSSIPVSLRLPAQGHEIDIPSGAIKASDGEVEFELAVAETEGDGDPLLMIAAHRIEGEQRTGYEFEKLVTIRISWAQCVGNPTQDPDKLKVYKTSDGGDSWRPIDGERITKRNQTFVEFEDDAFSGYIVIG